MKNWGLFLGGVVTGIILTFVFAFAITRCTNGNNGTPVLGVTDFEKPGQIINEKSVEVLQVISDNAALVKGEGTRISEDFEPLYDGPVYLLRNFDGKYYYDDEIIKLPKDKVFRQTGMYKYHSQLGEKNVAIIEIQ